MTIVAPKAMIAPATTGRRFDLFAPRKLAVTAAKIRIASRPSRKTIIPELKTAVPWLMCVLGRIGGTGVGGRHQVDEAGRPPRGR